MQSFIELYRMDSGKEVLMITKGQIEGIVLCRWSRGIGMEFVTWKIYRHNDWNATAHGKYFPFSIKDEALQYEKARNDFFARGMSIK